MDIEKFFKSMYFDIWQSNDISKISQYYAEDFKEIIDTTDKNKQPIELKLDYKDR